MTIKESKITFMIITNKNIFDENIVKIDPTTDKPLGNYLEGFQTIFLKAI